MEYVIIAITVVAVLGLCILVDFLFKRLFRSQAQHMSGLAVRLSKRYAAIGIILIVLGIAAVCAAFPLDGSAWILLGGGLLIGIVGIGLVIYYAITGIFYDDDGFIYTSFGKKKKVCFYRDIRAQQLYNNAGHLLIELYMNDGSAIQVQASMPGAMDFMDHAFENWLRQTGRSRESCEFYDRGQFVWFPPVEV